MRGSISCLKGSPERVDNGYAPFEASHTQSPFSCGTQQLRRERNLRQERHDRSSLQAQLLSCYMQLSAFPTLRRDWRVRGRSSGLFGELQPSRLLNLMNRDGFVALLLKPAKRQAGWTDLQERLPSRTGARLLFVSALMFEQTGLCLPSRPSPLRLHALLSG